MSVGQRLQRGRLRLKLSQEALAEILEVNTRSIRRWEHDAAVPHPFYREQLAHLFNVEMNVLFDVTTDEAENRLIFPVYWNVPYRRNPYFTGREVILEHLHRALHMGSIPSMQQAQAVRGLGGIGKTQTAVEYAYRFAHEYEAVLWFHTEAPETLHNSLMEIAHLLQFPLQHEQDLKHVIESVKGWLTSHRNWLLIFDNVEELELIEEVLPLRYVGQVLLTTRLQSTGTLAQSIDLESMPPEEGMLLLLRRAKLLTPTVQEASEKDQIVARELSLLLGGLPLALDQAGAYIEETACSLSAYRSWYEQHSAALHAWQSQSTPTYPHAVNTTFALSFQRVEHALPVAADLLRLCAFLHPDAIPEELFTLPVVTAASPLAPLASDPLLLSQAMATLMQQSLLKRDRDTSILMMHRMVQAVLKEQMDRASYQYWANQAVEVVNRGFPAVEELTTWSQCQRLLPHVLICLKLIEDEAIISPAAGRLLQQAGAYLLEQADYTLAELCIDRALHIRKQLLGEDHPEVAESLNHLAELYYYRGAYQQAKALHQQALSIRQERLGPQHLDVATSLNNLAGVFSRQGDYDEAESLYERALQIREQLLGSCHLDVAESLQNLAYLYMQQGRYGLAQPLYLRSLSICERLLERDHAYLTTILTGMGMLLQKQGLLEQAQEYYQQALGICQQRFSPEHPRLAQIYVSLGELSCIRGAYGQAESWYQQALQIQQKALGPEHPRTIQSLQALAQLYRTQGIFLQPTFFLPKSSL